MAQQFGIAPKQIVELAYTGPDLNLTPVTEAARDPATADKNYPIDCFWRNNVSRDLFFLSGFNSTGALWVKFLSSATVGIQQVTVPAGTSPVLPTAGGSVALTSSGATLTITGGLNTINFDLASSASGVTQVAVDASTGPGSNPVLPTGGGLMTVTGAQVAAGVVGANVIRTDSLAANTYTIEIQRTTTDASGAVAKNGVSHFNSGQFTVDSVGFVSLIGSTPPAQTFNIDAHTAPGTDPVVASAGGVVTITGAQVASGTVGTNVIRTDSLAANTYTIEIQRSAVAAVSTVANNGVAHYDNAVFTIDANGFVSLVGGAVPPSQKFTVDASTAPGTNPVVPTAGGVVTITGGQVASGTVGANVIRTDSLAANTIKIEIQRATSAAATDSTKNGVCHFDSSSFSVDANGFVTSTTPATFAWSDKALAFNAAANNGYVSTNALTASLPAAGQPNGTTIAFIQGTAGALKISPATTDKIRVASSLSTNGMGGGFIQGTAIGNTIELVYQSSTGTWINVASNGNWTVS